MNVNDPLQQRRDFAETFGAEAAKRVLRVLVAYAAKADSIEVRAGRADVVLQILEMCAPPPEPMTIKKEPE